MTEIGTKLKPVPKRPAVAIVTSYWGDARTEAVGASRVLAGALALHADVTVIHLADDEPATYADSVFEVRRVSVRGAEPTRAMLLRQALAARNGSGDVPAAGLALLSEYDGEAPGVLEVLEATDPVSVVLVGSYQPWDLVALGRGHRRVVTVPFCSERPLFASELAALIEAADVVGAIHPGEFAEIAAAAPERASDVVALDIAFGSNAHARAEELAGIGKIGPYSLLVRSFPEGGPRAEATVGCEVLRYALDGFPVAEVDGNTWWLTAKKGIGPLRVGKNRVNFARLVAHAKVMVDVRPQGPVGRLAIEAMLYGVPIVVPDDSAAKAHAEAANGGLWYRDEGELFDETRAIIKTPLGDRLAEQARAYAEKRHGDIDAFTARVAALVLGIRSPVDS